MAFFGGVRSPDTRRRPDRICSVRSGSIATTSRSAWTCSSWSASSPDSSTTRWINGSRSVRRTVSSIVPCARRSASDQVGDDVIESPRVGRQLTHELRLLLRVLLVLEDLRDAEDAGERLLRVHRQLLHERDAARRSSSEVASATGIGERRSRPRAARLGSLASPRPSGPVGARPRPLRAAPLEACRSFSSFWARSSAAISFSVWPARRSCVTRRSRPGRRDPRPRRSPARGVPRSPGGGG